MLMRRKANLQKNQMLSSQSTYLMFSSQIFVVCLLQGGRQSPFCFCLEHLFFCLFCSSKSGWKPSKSNASASGNKSWATIAEVNCNIDLCFVLFCFMDWDLSWGSGVFTCIRSQKQQTKINPFRKELFIPSPFSSQFSSRLLRNINIKILHVSKYLEINLVLSLHFLIRSNWNEKKLFTSS